MLLDVAITNPGGRFAVSQERAAPRKRVLKIGYIIISDKAPKIECVVRNISEIGASLQVSTTVGIPTNFIAVIEGVRRNCRSVWRTDTKIGIMF